MAEDAAIAPPVDPSSYPDYPTKCLMCGASLSIVAFPQGDTPPWGCVPCGRGYWPAELRGAIEHPGLFHPLDGWPSDVRTVAILDRAEAEADRARRVGTSLLPEQLHMVDDATLTFWRTRRIAPAIVALIDAHLTFRHYQPPPPKKANSKRTPRKD